TAMRRFTSSLLTVLMLLSVLASCGSTESTETQPAAGDAAEQVQTETEVPETTRDNYPDGLPEKDFGGREYVICNQQVKQYEIYSEELTGEACNDAVFHRNVEIEERFNTKIGALVNEFPEDIMKEAAMSGDAAFTIAGYVDYKAYVPIAAGAALNWNDIPYVDQEKPWHNKLANEPSTINGKLFAINSDLSISSLQYTYAIFVNYKLSTDYGYAPEDLYKIVFDGKWTLDTFTEIVKDLWVDTNGNGKHDGDDVHGYSMYPNCTTSDVWLAALDLPVATINNDGTYSVDFFCEKTVSALEKTIALHTAGDGVYLGAPGWRQIPVDFCNGKIMMTQMYFGETTESLKDMEDTYGILPMPKFDESQTEYLTNAWDQFSVFSVPVTADDLEFVGIIFEALSAESWRSVFPAYYDTALKSRYSSDPVVAEIVDLIMEGRQFEFSFQFGEDLQNLPYLFRKTLYAKSTDIASQYQKIESKLNESIKKMYGYFD
ncbi:MAG: hypothetical protein IKY52_01935, partial [Clostridia bacterium]|nr:hypothetical protein [Clostridia bacterium]